MNDDSVMKILIKLFVTGVIVLLFTGMWALRQISIEGWLASVTSPDVQPVVKAVGLIYIKNFADLGHYNRSENLPPLQFVLNGCSDRFPSDGPCRQSFDWLLEMKEDINATDSTKLGFTPIHNAVTECNPNAVEYLLEKNANVAATGEKFRGQTPLKLLSLLKKCSSTLKIVELLKQKSGHE